MHGLARKESLGKTVEEVMPGLAPILEPILRKVIRTGEPVLKSMVPAATLSEPGVLDYWTVSCFPINGEDGNRKSVGMILENITEHKQAEQALLESEKRLRAILDYSPNPIFLKDRDFRYLLISKEFERTFQISEQQIKGKKDEDVFPLGQAARFRANDLQVLQTGVPMVFEEAVMHQNGPHVHILHKFPLRGEEGDIYAIGGIATDITDREKAEKKLRESEEHFRLLIEGLKEYAIFMLDPAGTVVSWNASSERLKGYRTEEILGRHFSCLYTSEDRKARKPEQALAMASARGTFQEEGWRLRKDGTRFWADVVITALREESGKLRGFAKIIRDASERKQAEEALRQLSSQLLKLQDEERRRLARELHDSTAQRLTALAAYLAVVEKSAGPLNRQALSALSECRTLTEECHREIRTLSYLLHPPMLDEIGLPDALRWYCDGFTKRSGIPVDLRISSDVGRLPPDVEGTLFRIVQESLTNIHRHSASPTARIRLDRNGNKLILEVRDEGRGLPLEMLVGGRINRANLGVGIAGMQERVRHLQGGLDIASGKRGTTVTAMIPIPEVGL
jgi:PAS domain S-box-containing protein